MNRRTLLRKGAAGGGGLLSLVALERLSARAALAADGTDATAKAAIAGESYGPLAPKADQRGQEILALPEGFSYVTFGYIGATMSDGNRTPLAHDGMAAFQGPGNRVRLIRNHEDRNAPGKGSIGGNPRRMYDPTAGGGTTTLDYDPATRTLVQDYVSLNGTTVNCAGGSASARGRGSPARRPSSVRTTPCRRCGSPCGTGTASRSRSTGAPASSGGRDRSPRWADSLTRRSQWISAPGSST